MFNASNLQGTCKNLKLMIMWFCGVNDDMGLHSVSDFYAVLQNNFTRVTITSDGNVIFFRIKSIM